MNEGYSEQLSGIGLLGETEITQVLKRASESDIIQVGVGHAGAVVHSSD
jgi:hypothetical protein